MLDTLLSGQLLFAAAVLGALYALVGLGLNLVYGTMRLLNVAHGDVLMLGAFAAYGWFALIGLSPLVALPLVAALGAGLGLALYAALFRRQIATAPSPAAIEARSLLLFFGVSIVIQNLAALAFGATPRAYRHLDEVYHLGDVAMTGNRITALLVAASVLMSILLLLRRTFLGMEIAALIQNREAAQIVGIDVGRVQAAAIALGFATATVAGALVSMSEPINPFMGLRFTIAAFVTVIMGGLGNVHGGIAAGFVLAAIEIYAVTVFSAEARSILIYGAFVVVLLLRPQGLLGRARGA